MHLQVSLRVYSGSFGPRSSWRRRRRLTRPRSGCRCWREFSFTLSRTTVREGNAEIELANFGQDPHDLHVQPLGQGRAGNLGSVALGNQGELLIKLKPGRYELYCSLGNHRSLGMDAVLVVKGR
jgi:plastocyanin